jgi:hypothetical protein
VDGKGEVGGVVVLLLLLLLMLSAVVVEAVMVGRVSEVRVMDS